MGSIGKDIEVTNTPSWLAIAKTSLATNERVKNWEDYEDRTTWHNLVAFGHTANFLNKYFQKWSKVLLEGKISNTSWEKEDWTKWYKSEIIVDKLEFAWAKKDGAEATEYVAQNKEKVGKFKQEETISIEDIPF